MPRHQKIIDLLSDEHWAAFHALIGKRGTTVDAAFRWVVGQGYSISRTAVAGYIRRYRSRPLFMMSMDLGHMNEADVRAQLIQWIQTIDGDRLAALSIFAALMRNAEPVQLPAKDRKPR